MHSFYKRSAAITVSLLLCSGQIMCTQALFGRLARSIHRWPPDCMMKFRGNNPFGMRRVHSEGRVGRQIKSSLKIGALFLGVSTLPMLAAYHCEHCPSRSECRICGFDLVRLKEWRKFWGIEENPYEKDNRK